MKVLVTGAAGFIGSTLSARLLEDGHEVIGIDALTDYYDPAIKLRNLGPLECAAFTFIQGDLNELDLEKILGGVRVVFHQAGQPGVRKSWGDDFSMYTQENVNATQRLLEAVRKSSSIQRVVYASSSSIYGEAERYPTHEKDRPSPLSPYGVTKLAAEHLCSLYAANFGVPTVSLRYFTVYGPGQRPDMAFTRFIRAALNGEGISVFGSGNQVRDFTFVDDVVEANVLAGFGSSPPGAIFNVAGGSSASVNEVLDVVQDLAGSKLLISREGPLAGDVLRTGGETTAIRAALGWCPKVGLSDGLARQFAWGQAVYGGVNA